MTTAQYVIPEGVSPEVRAELEAKLPALIEARETLMGFCAATFRGYHRAPHLELIAGELERLVRKENDRLIIALPPRHGKSELVSIRFPAWVLCREPWRKVISASYGDVLATEVGRKAREIMLTQQLFPSVRLDASSKSKNLWHIDKHGGQFYSVGIGSGVTGFGGDIIAIDDPIKERVEAESEAKRASVWDWYTDTLLGRQEPNAGIVLVMHRWHTDDLAGRLLQVEGDQREGGQWKVISLPALAEDDDLLGRKPGEPLWPVRYDLKALERRRKSVGTRGWNSLYQQRPAPEKGDIFQWFPTYETLPPSFRQINLSFDMALTRGRRSDYTAWAAWGLTQSRAYLIEAGRIKAEIPEAERFIHQAYRKIVDRFPNTLVRPIYRSGVALDRTAAQHLQRGVTVVDDAGTMSFLGLPVIMIPMPSGVKKEEFAVIVSVEFESERALIPEFAPWLGDWLEEHKTFPHGKHDDYVETTNTALYDAFRTTPFVRPPKRNLLAGRL